MTTIEQKQLSTFFHHFDLTSLGDGDLIAGANTLASVACAIASIATRDSGIISKGGKGYYPGCSLLVSGGLSSKMVRMELVSELGASQTNLVKQIQRLHDDEEELARSPGPRASSPVKRPDPNFAESILGEIFHNSHLALNQPSDNWSTVSSAAPAMRLEDFSKHNRFVALGKDARDLKKQTAKAHKAQILVVTTLPQGTSMSVTSEFLTEIMDGVYADGASIIQGDAFVLDSGCLLNDMAKNAKGSSEWIEQCVWLTDSESGPEVPILEGKPQDRRNIHKMIAGSVSRAVGARYSDGVTVIDIDIEKQQTAWVDFLKTMEESLPGITGTARNFFATLLYGIHALFPENKHKTAEGFASYLPHIETFARFLIQRMSNTREMIVHADRRKKLESLQARLLDKLEERGHTARELTRRFNRLPISDCREALQNLERAELVVCVDGEYSLANTSNQLTINV